MRMIGLGWVSKKKRDDDFISMSLELLYLWNVFLPFPLVGKQAFTYHPGDSRKCVGSGGPVRPTEVMG